MEGRKRVRAHYPQVRDDVFVEKSKSIESRVIQAQIVVLVRLLRFSASTVVSKRK